MVGRWKVDDVCNRGLCQHCRVSWAMQCRVRRQNVIRSTSLCRKLEWEFETRVLFQLSSSYERILINICFHIEDSIQLELAYVTLTNKIKRK